MKALVSIFAAGILLFCASGYTADVENWDGAVGGNVNAYNGWGVGSAAWGTGIPWTLKSSGQPSKTGSTMGAVSARTDDGSTAHAKTFGVSTGTNGTVAVTMARLDAKWSGGGRWCETDYQLGTWTSAQCEANTGTWNIIIKWTEANTGTQGWTRVETGSFSSGANSTLTLCFKNGTNSSAECFCQVDTLEINGFQDVHDWSLY